MSKTVKANDYPPKERPDRRKREAWPLWVIDPLDVPEQAKAIPDDLEAAS